MKQEALTRNFRAHGARKSYMYTTAIVVVSFKVKTILSNFTRNNSDA